MKILIIDDVLGWRNYHSKIVSELIPEAKIELAETAYNAYNKIIEHSESPFDIILTDMQMEQDYEPLYAGEWLIERIQELKQYKKTKIIIISAAYNIETIAQNYNVNYLRKTTARNFPDSYSIIK